MAGISPAPAKFLSRLHGGEFVVRRLHRVGEFLSRLHGGEFFGHSFCRFYLFLSRLHGGEVRGAAIEPVVGFLSRLHGGEYSTSTKKNKLQPVLNRNWPEKPKKMVQLQLIDNNTEFIRAFFLVKTTVLWLYC